MARTEFFDDPDAPTPNSVVIAASAAVFDGDGRLLMQRRTDNGLWALPGGAMEQTESLPAAAVREVKEETGIDVEIVGLVGTYTDPRHIIAYDDGEVRRQFNICFRARPIGGTLRVSAESTEVHWISPDNMASLTMHRTQRLRISHALEVGRIYLG
ncbi:8-oxo-dGTP pyrophosphatase MutT (NUDIX family) [Nocardiopsis mwathae]|uniref:8-oxo-dGTP pyrophosphatase MutT (NUDIX family) n=1 Tax=Nocardiopsis mwathae TaxID=1472723 RepID=A0A7X0D645_9ACTN|nr:NUDIX domain-containing protein [Nocardiopsis mwathae]MBB6171739.1 8-oxo-dGTP pyrophosphatase MutT (NUDIX family) [Nocardiopsis mwathae]